MIRSIRGTAIYIGESSMVLETGGIGYEIQVPQTDLLLRALGEEYRLWVKHVVREDSEELMGFSEYDDVLFFELLCTVSGVGPKTALGILDRSPRITLARAITRGDADTLTALGGMGKKTAEKIILTLKDKVVSDGEGFQEEKHLLEALEGLGYARREVTTILPNLTSNQSLEDMIREAIRLLSNK